MAALDITQTQILTDLRAFLISAIPAGVDVIRAQVNRVPEPQGADFILMTPGGQKRLAWNIHESQDCAFMGAISGATMTVTSVSTGAIQVGAPVFGLGVAAGTTVTAFGTGTGGAGTYSVSPSQTVASEQLAAGFAQIIQQTEFRFQIDVHGPSSADNAQKITTLFRDEYGVSFLGALPAKLAPLYANDPVQIPFVNGEQQYEDRWVIDLRLQTNPTVTVPQQYFTSATVGLINVDVTYPPGA